MAYVDVLDEPEVPDGALTIVDNNTDPSIAEAMYPPATLTRLRSAKSHYDPDNLFRRNHNIALTLEAR